MNWFAVGGAILWCGVTVQATIEIESIRRAAEKPRRWYSRICGWVMVVIGTGAGYAAYVHKPGYGWVTFVCWVIISALMVCFALYLVRNDDLAYPGDPKPDAPRTESVRGKRSRIVDLVLAILVVKTMFTKRK